VHITGWQCITGLGDFKEGEFAVYFESDSKLPEVEPFCNNEFLVNKHYQVKCQKLRGVVSDGLLMPISAFGWKTQTAWVETNEQSNVVTEFVFNPKTNERYFEYEFLTKKLNVTYNVTDDNARKASTGDKLQTIKGRHPKFFRNPVVKKLMRYEWFRKFAMFLFRKSAKKAGWPEWVVKTDEERCQNLLNWEENYAGTKHWIVTEKIDGSSSTFTFNIRRKKGVLVCSRNVVFDKPDKKCYYETNIYTEMAEKYHIEDVITDLMKKNPSWKFCTIQGEVFGGNIQKRDYSTTEHDIRAFNLIDSENGRWNSIEAEKCLLDYKIKWVPILDMDFTLPNTVDELLKYAHGKSIIDGKEREGIVLRSQDGKQSFKAVDPEFILKYHIN